MTVIRVVACGLLPALAACAPAGVADEEPAPDHAASIVGSWEMIEFEMVVGSDTTRREADFEPLALTVFTPDHFAYVWRGQANAGAGTYVFDGTTITQTFQYPGNGRGEIVATFLLEVDGDLMRFAGPLRVVGPSGEDMTDQFPQLVEVRRRVGSKR